MRKSFLVSSPSLSSAFPSRLETPGRGGEPAVPSGAMLNEVTLVSSSPPVSLSETWGRVAGAEGGKVSLKERK